MTAVERKSYGRLLEFLGSEGEVEARQKRKPERGGEFFRVDGEGEKKSDSESNKEEIARVVRGSKDQKTSLRLRVESKRTARL